MPNTINHSNSAQPIESSDSSLAQFAVKPRQKWDFLWPLLCLFLIELIAFGINLKKIGIYQDEWISFQELHFASSSLVKAVSTFFWDPRVIVRPLEALHFAPLFFLVRENPFWYHFVCYFFEFLSGCFLFLTICRLGASRAIALATAVLFLLYPTHDSTHYVIVASSLPVSMAFFIMSLWLFLKGIDENRYSLTLWSAAAYFVSIYNYEFCLPLVVLYPLLAMFKLSEVKPANRFRWFALQQIPCTVTAISMIVYRVLLANTSLGWRYKTIFSVSHFFSVITAGIAVNLSLDTIRFCAFMIVQALNETLSILAWLCLIAAVVIVYVSLHKENQLKQNNNGLSLILAGALTLFFSYTIYGISPEHAPIIDGWLNRVNLGGSLGACLMIGGFLALWLDHAGVINFSVRRNVFACVVALFAGALILVDWQFAKPWIVSWQSQKEIMAMLKRHANEIKSGDSIIIGDILRYASKWAPVVDGVWDFQNIVRTTYNDASLKGTVVTDRLKIKNDVLADCLGSSVIDTFPFKQMILYSPRKWIWVRISSRQEFVDQAHKLGWTIADSQ